MAPSAHQKGWRTTKTKKGDRHRMLDVYEDPHNRADNYTSAYPEHSLGDIFIQFNVVAHNRGK